MSFNFTVGEEGFEPPHAWTKTMCLTAWLLPIRLSGGFIILINPGYLSIEQIEKDSF
ncbi:MAG: hypothetical protein ACD_15C00108G0002 [uncultured bacterium]|nr:MAG: hypothetical protein ACD_15C00108G0002 [uncultured bacterium]